MSGICRIGPAGAELAAVQPRKYAFGASGPPKTDRRSREGQFPAKTRKTPQIRGSLVRAHRVQKALRRQLSAIRRRAFLLL